MNRFEALAADWIRALRGRRSQRALSRRLGYRSNSVYRWETGRCFPTARVLLSTMARLGGHDVRASLLQFYGDAPPWIHAARPDSREGVARLLDDLRGRTPIVELADKTGFSRHSIARWLSGAAEPKLPQWLALIEASSLRLLDFVASFVDPSKLPSVCREWQRLQAVREAAYSRPESHIVPRVLELADYARRRRHDDDFIAQRIGLSLSDVSDCLKLLEAAGMIRWQSEKWVPVEESVVDTRHDEARARTLEAFWLRRAAEHASSGGEGIFGYNLFSISKRDLAKVQEIHLRYYREIQGVIARSKPNDHVALFAAQLFRLDHDRGSHETSRR